MQKVLRYFALMIVNGVASIAIEYIIQYTLNSIHKHMLWKKLKQLISDVINDNKELIMSMVISVIEDNLERIIEKVIERLTQKLEQEQLEERSKNEV